MGQKVSSTNATETTSTTGEVSLDNKASYEAAESQIKKLQAHTSNLQNKTGLNKVESTRLVKVFNSLAEKGVLGKKSFDNALKSLEEYGLNKISGTPLAERLYILFDTNEDGKIDKREFLSGLALLCKGTVDEKLELTFRAYDIDNSGFITQDELVDLFSDTYESAMRALKAAYLEDELQDTEETEQFFQQLKTQFKQTMEGMMEKAISTLDQNDDKKLNLEEFKAFSMGNPAVVATLNGFMLQIPMTFLFASS